MMMQLKGVPAEGATLELFDGLKIDLPAKSAWEQYPDGSYHMLGLDYLPKSYSVDGFRVDDSIDTEWQLVSFAAAPLPADLSGADARNPKAVLEKLSAEMTRDESKAANYKTGPDARMYQDGQQSMVSMNFSIKQVGGEHRIVELSGGRYLALVIKKMDLLGNQIVHPHVFVAMPAADGLKLYSASMGPNKTLDEYEAQYVPLLETLRF